MALEFTTSYLKDSLSLFRKYKKLAEDAMVQVADEQLFAVSDSESNSIAVIVRHVAGNLCSRWTDFLTTDGEKPWRNRDTEFSNEVGSREVLMETWEAGWTCLFAAIEPLTETDLGGRVTIRGEAHSVLQAINRQLAHYAYHVGQIVWLSKHYQSAQWKPLTVAKGKSAEFNSRVLAGELSQR
jgi:hypothetical protein